MAKLSSVDNEDENTDDDDADLPLPDVQVQRSTQEFYEQHQHEVP